MSTELEPSALPSSGGELEEPLAARLVESALDEAFSQMVAGAPDSGAAEAAAAAGTEAEAEEEEEEEEGVNQSTDLDSPTHAATPLAHKLVAQAMEEAVERMGREAIEESGDDPSRLAKEAESREAESKEAEPKEAEPKEAEPKEAEPKEAESKEAEPKEAESKEAELPKKEAEVEAEKPDDYMDILGNGLLRKKTLVPGKGRDTRPLHGDLVTISYVSYLNDDMTEIERDETTFVVGDGDVVQALDLAVTLSELQENFELISDARFAYGKKGLPPRIPPNACLRFVAVLERCDEPPAYASMTPQQRLARANEKRERGNFLFEREEYALSINSYSKALDVLSHQASEEASGQEVLDTKIKIYNNIAAAQIRIEAFDAAVQSCDEVLKLSPDNVKALFRRGKAKVGAGEFSEAVRCLRAALRIDPDSRIVQTELSRVLARVKKERESQQALYRRMFGREASAAEEAPPAGHNWRRFLFLGAGVALVGVSVALASAAIKYHQQHA